MSSRGLEFHGWDSVMFLLLALVYLMLLLLLLLLLLLSPLLIFCLLLLAAAAACLPCSIASMFDLMIGSMQLFFWQSCIVGSLSRPSVDGGRLGGLVHRSLSAHVAASRVRCARAERSLPDAIALQLSCGHAPRTSRASINGRDCDLVAIVRRRQC